MKPYLTDLVVNKVALRINYNKECELGNLMTNLIHIKFPFADFFVIDLGGLRVEWFPGVLKEKDLVNMFPMGETLKSFKLLGRDLLKTLKIVQEGNGGFYQFYGIQTIATIQNNQRKFISAKMMDGSEIEESK